MSHCKTGLNEGGKTRKIAFQLMKAARFHCLFYRTFRRGFPPHGPFDFHAYKNFA